MVDLLMNEIIEAQKARNSLDRWKLVVVAVLGAAGLGMKEFDRNPLILSAIPVACVYVDLLCVQLWLQMEVVGAYSRNARKEDTTKREPASEIQAKEKTNSGNPVKTIVG